MMTESDRPSPRHAIRGLRRWLSMSPESIEDLESLIDSSGDFLTDDMIEMLRGVLDLPTTPIREIMIPRGKMVGFKANEPLETILPTIIDTAHSRFPIYDDQDADSVIGILLAKDLLRLMGRPDAPFQLRDWIRQPIFVPETASAGQLLAMLKNTQSHLAIVVDEFGTTAGLITLEDLLEEIVGEIEDEHDDTDPLADLITEDGQGGYYVHARTPIEYFNDELNTQLAADSVDTIGGLVVQHLDRLIDRVGEQVQIGDWGFRVDAADDRALILLHAQRHSEHD